jgi:hypothetical protein
MQEGQTMSEERAQILEMLVAGRVTVEQAEQLLDALDGPSPSASRGAVAEAGPQRPGDDHSEDFFASLTAEQLVALRDSDVSRAFVEQMRAAGLNTLRIEDLIELHDEGITPRFVLDLQEAGLADLTRDQLVELYCHGVDAAFVREMRGLGYSDLTPSKWVALRDNGVEDDEPAEQDEWE